jgi:curved DNA-binding protein CbpA
MSSAAQKHEIKRIRGCRPSAFYEILGLPILTTETEIRKAYLALSLLVHPDKNGNEVAAMEAFQMLQRAYETLVDPKKRRDHAREDMNRAKSEGPRVSRIYFIDPKLSGAGL